MSLSPTMRIFLAVIALAAGLVGIKRIALDSYDEKEVYRKDFVQEYVMAKAIVDGVPIYPPMPELMARYFDPPPKVPWLHPAPHTPVAATLAVPIGFFPYKVAATLWIVFELGCLAAILELLCREWGEPVSLATRAVLFLVCLGTGPVIHELWYGQFSLLLTLFLTIAWLSLRRERDAIGGANLGFAVAMKLAAWPVGVYLFLRGRWRAVLAAVVVVVGLNLLAVACIGWTAVIDYYTRVGPTVTKEYNQHDENFSLWTVAPRLFSPKVADVASNFIAYAPWPNETLFRVLTPGLPLLALAIVLAMALRCRQFDSAFGILICASLPLNPVVWDHYLIMTAVPIAIVFRRLKDAGFPRGLTALALIGLIVAIFPNPAYLEAATKLFAIGEAYNVKVLPFAVSLITYAPMIPLVTWIAILWRTDDGSPTPSACR